jgi:hypothetical protein
MFGEGGIFFETLTKHVLLLKIVKNMVLPVYLKKEYIKEKKYLSSYKNR